MHVASLLAKLLKLVWLKEAIRCMAPFSIFSFNLPLFQPFVSFGSHTI